MSAAKKNYPYVSLWIYHITRTPSGCISALWKHSLRSNFQWLFVWGDKNFLGGYLVMFTQSPWFFIFLIRKISSWISTFLRNKIFQTKNSRMNIHTLIVHPNSNVLPQKFKIPYPLKLFILKSLIHLVSKHSKKTLHQQTFF